MMYLRVAVCVLILVFAAMGVGGCSTGARAENMVPDQFAVQIRHNASVTIEVSGGKESSIWTNGEISDGVFRKTLEDSIRNSGVFARVSESRASAEYALRVSGINPISNEASGFDMRASFVANWELLEIKSGTSVWKDVLTTDHTCTVGDAFVGANRNRMAKEIAAKENIQMAIEEMSKVRLPGE